MLRLTPSPHPRRSECQAGGDLYQAFWPLTITFLSFPRAYYTTASPCPAHQEKLPLSFVPSDALAAEGRRLRASASSPGGAHPQSQAARDGLSEAERKVHALLVRIYVCVACVAKPAVV